MRLSFMFFLLCMVPSVSFSATIEVPKDFASIQGAIGSAAIGDTILVSPGTYYENINFLGKAVTLKSTDGAEQTIIDGFGQFAPVAAFTNNEAPDSVLDGFTLTNGSGFPINPTVSYGGGIYINSASPTITNNIITNNTALTSGGGIYFENNASPNITHNRIHKNLAHYNGGGVVCYKHCDPVIHGNVILDNQAMNQGGGLHCTWTSAPVITFNLIQGNSANESGGGIYGEDTYSFVISSNIICKNLTKRHGGGVYCYKSSPKINNNMIHDNEADYRGGGVHCEEGNTFPVLTNNTLYGNQAGVEGGAVAATYLADVKILNSILWHNTAPKGPEIWVGENAGFPAHLSISHSTVKGGAASVHVEKGCFLDWGLVMYKDDPLFLDPANGDFHIGFDSPCINSGKTKTVTEIVDFENDPRIHYGKVDIGADEFHTHLYCTGNFTPGGNINLKFIDMPNSTPVILWLGSGVLDPPMQLPNHGDWFLQFPILMQAPLGVIPGPKGVLDLLLTIPSNLAVPLELPLQAGIGGKLTNLCLLKIQ